MDNLYIVIFYSLINLKHIYQNIITLMVKLRGTPFMAQYKRLPQGVTCYGFGCRMVGNASTYHVPKSLLLSWKTQLELLLFWIWTTGHRLLFISRAFSLRRGSIVIRNNGASLAKLGRAGIGPVSTVPGFAPRWRLGKGWIGSLL